MARATPRLDHVRRSPAITLYRGEGFAIDVYFWVDHPLTSIHNHRFSGAFVVLKDSVSI
jgi:hypothetical protein